MKTAREVECLAKVNSKRFCYVLDLPVY
jgi:hypothetical protein